jgi:methyltransferase family protein
MSDPLVASVERSLLQAQLGVSKLDKAIFFLNGMSSPRVRHFLNNLCEFSGTRYLEVGCWRGSTLISALHKNHTTVTRALAIDNFSEFQQSEADLLLNVNPLIDLLDASNRPFFLNGKPPKDDLREKLDAFVPQRPAQFEFIDGDCFAPELLAALKSGPPCERINTYLYDGAHDEESQRRAFTEYDPLLDDRFIAIVDDWNCPGVKEGTYSAFSELAYQVIRQWELPAQGNGDIHNWWNGLYVAVIHKAGVGQN